MKYVFPLFLLLNLTAWSQLEDCDIPRDSKHTGHCSYTYESGQSRKEINYKSGFLHGEYLEFYESGALLAKATFDMGTLVGNAYRYFPDSSIHIAIELDETGAGTFNEYSYYSDHVRRTGYVKRNYRNGTWVSYNWEGDISEEINFNADSLIKLGNRGTTQITFEEETIGEVFLKEYGLEPEIDNETIVEFPDIEAVFEGGREGMMLYIQKNVRYPIEAIEKNIVGKVYLSFIVELDGSVSDIKVRREAHPLLDAEAVRVISKMTQWTPAITNGEFVRTRCILPVVFSLTEPKQNKKRKRK